MKRLNEIKRLQQLAGINEIKINNPIRPKLSFNLLINIDKLISYDLWSENEKNIINNIMGNYIDDNLVQTISSEINGDEIFSRYPYYLEEPSFQDNFKGFIENWYKLPPLIRNKL